MKKKTKCYISLILEVLILLVQIFFDCIYTYKNGFRKDYSGFMNEVNRFIDFEKFPNYKKKFEKVFGDDWNEFFSFNPIIRVFISSVIFLSLGLSFFGGVIINFFSVCKNRTINVSLLLFLFCSIDILGLIAYSIFGEKTDLDLSEEDLKKFKSILELINKNLNEVKRTVSDIRFY